LKLNQDRALSDISRSQEGVRGQKDNKVSQPKCNSVCFILAVAKCDCIYLSSNI